MPTKKERELEQEKVIYELNERSKKLEAMLEALLDHVGLKEEVSEEK